MLDNGQVNAAGADNGRVAKACYQIVPSYKRARPGLRAGLFRSKCRVALPLYYDRWGDGVAPTFRAVDGQAALGDRFFRNATTQPQLVAAVPADNAAEQGTFRERMDEVAVAALAARAQVAEHAAG